MDREEASLAAIRCGFCGEMNDVDVAAAAEGPTCGHCSKPVLLDRPIKVAQEDFERTVLQARVPVMVDFYADWCAPCKMVAPLIDEFAYDQIGKMLVVKVDTDHAPDLAMKYEIRSIPTVVVFIDGEEKDRSLGFEPERLRDFVARAVA